VKRLPAARAPDQRRAIERAGSVRTEQREELVVDGLEPCLVPEEPEDGDRARDGSVHDAVASTPSADERTRAVPSRVGRGKRSGERKDASSRENRHAFGPAGSARIGKRGE
jgi:hypothetical protein